MKLTNELSPNPWASEHKEEVVSDSSSRSQQTSVADQTSNPKVLKNKGRNRFLFIQCIGHFWLLDHNSVEVKLWELFHRAEKCKQSKEAWRKERGHHTSSIQLPEGALPGISVPHGSQHSTGLQAAGVFPQMTWERKVKRHRKKGYLIAFNLLNLRVQLNELLFHWWHVHPITANCLNRHLGEMTWSVLRRLKNLSGFY